ncbi:MAG: hypothetical protein AAGD04_03230 [Pseudomonadota bacterium]
MSRRLGFIIGLFVGVLALIVIVFAFLNAGAPDMEQNQSSSLDQSTLPSQRAEVV